MLYDDAAEKWVASGTSQGLSQVRIYRHITNNTLRVVRMMNQKVSNRCKSRCGLLVICRNRMFYNNGGIHEISGFRNHQNSVHTFNSQVENVDKTFRG